MTGMAKTEKKVPRTIGGFTWFVLKEIVGQRKWVLFPVWLILGVIALLMLFGGTSALLPSIYVAF